MSNSCDRKSLNSAFDEELTSEFEKLSNEFECFGLTPLEELYGFKRLMLLQVIDNVHSLISMHKQLVSKTNEAALESAQTKKDNIQLNKIVATSKVNLSCSEENLRALEDRLKKKDVEIIAVQEQKLQLKLEIAALQNKLDVMEGECKHKVNKAAVENFNLQRHMANFTGTYKSNDEYLCELLNKYKIRETIYKETIQKLEENNKAILEEVLNLQEMVLSKSSSNDCK